MDKSTKIILIAAGGIALVGGTILLLTKKSKNKNNNGANLLTQVPVSTQAQPNNFTVNNGGGTTTPTIQPTTTTTTASNASHNTGNQQNSTIQQRVEAGQQAQNQPQNIINEVANNSSPSILPSLAMESAIKKLYAANKDMDSEVEQELLKWENSMKPKLQNLTPKFSNPRGYRNNNPGNIRHNPANNWNGKTGVDSDGFVIFSNRKYGYRAMVRILKNYQIKHSNPSYITIAEKIGRYAPENDNNNTSGYINHVCAMTSMTPETKIGVNNAAQLCILVYAMTIVENGYAPLPSMAEIIEGYKMEKS